MTSQYFALHPDDDVRGIIFYGFPLHPPGKPSVERAAHLDEVKTPMLFLQGTRDELANWELIQSVCSRLKLAQLEKIEGANHAFKAGKQDIMKVLVGLSLEWISQKTN
jgi:predicted alpha/beta-hydrolase family hydrolase